MSTTDDKTKKIADDAAKTPLPGEETDENGNGDIGLPTLFFIFGFALTLIIGWIVFPALLYSKKYQPIDFNHVMHNELVDNGCKSCHFLRKDGTFSGAPKLEQCIECHDEMQGDSKDEAIFVEEYVSKGREVPWLIYAKQPDCVFFSHAAHTEMGNMECATCHGDIGKSTSLKPYEENRLTGYPRDIWGNNKSIMNLLNLKDIMEMVGLIDESKMDQLDGMKMDDCAECHIKETGRDTSVTTKKDGCFVCHK